MAKNSPKNRRFKTPSETQNKSKPVIKNKQPTIQLPQPKNLPSVEVSTPKTKSAKIPSDKTTGRKRKAKTTLTEEQKRILRENKLATTKERQRVKAFIKRAYDRGYDFSPQLLKDIESMDLNGLVALQPEALYALATTSKFGYPMSGTEARQLERKIAARKAQETRKQKEDPDYIPFFSDIVLENLYSLIEEARVDDWEKAQRNSYIVQDYLDDEVAAYGRDTVAMCCEYAPEALIALCKDALYQYDEGKCRDKTTNLVMLIRSFVPTVEESKEFTTQP